MAEVALGDHHAFGQSGGPRGIDDVGYLLIGASVNRVGGWFLGHGVVEGIQTEQVRGLEGQAGRQGLLRQDDAYSGILEQKAGASGRRRIKGDIAASGFQNG